MSTQQLWAEWDVRPQTILLPDERDAELGYNYFMGMPVHRHAGVWFGMLAPFLWNNLYASEIAWSRDGWDFQRLPKREHFIEFGADGAWDHSMVVATPRWVEVGVEWWFYYAAFDGAHDDPKGRTGAIGLATLLLDHAASDAAARFKMIVARSKKPVGYQLALHVSPDGRHWSEELAASGPSWDRSTAFWNPFRSVWVASVRGHDRMLPEPVHRVRNYHEGRTPEAMLNWTQHTDKVAQGEGLPHDLQPWVAADRLDPRHPDPRFQQFAPQLYNLDVFPYESLLVGLFTIWQGPDNDTCKQLHMHKRNEVFVGFTRDGFHWDRANRGARLEDRPHEAPRPEFGGRVLHSERDGDKTRRLSTRGLIHVIWRCEGR